MPPEVFTVFGWYVCFLGSSHTSSRLVLGSMKNSPDQTCKGHPWINFIGKHRTQKASLRSMRANIYILGGITQKIRTPQKCYFPTKHNQIWKGFGGPSF